MPVFNARNPLEYLLGAGELGLSGVTNLASMVGSVPYGIYKQMESGEYGQNTDAFDKYSKQMMDAGTYQPRTAAAQDIGSLIGSLMEDAKIPPVMPELMPLAALSANPVARNAQIERAGMAAERAIEPAVIRTLEKGGANAQSLMDMVRGSMSPMDVYHGSPFKFDQFASKAIGSGEGAQAYGYGHYLAESPDVAKGYATNLANRDMANQGRLNPHANAQRLANLAGDAKYAADDVRFVLESNPDHAQKALLEETLKMLDSGDYKLPLTNSGSFYKVDLPDDQMAKMLDFDAELGKQTPEVQALAKQYGLNMDDLGGDLVARMNAKLPAGAESMRQSGITGIRYKDAQSRGGQQADTSNFVVFPGNEGLLSILERNEVSIPRGGLLEGKGFEAISPDASGVFGTSTKGKLSEKTSDSLANIENKFKDVSLDLYEKDSTINLSRIVVPKGMRKSGVGTDVMQDLTSYADKTGQRVVLTPSSVFGGNVKKLKDFYKRFGFIENKGKNKDFTTMESMIRSPQPARQQEIVSAQRGLLDAVSSDASDIFGVGAKKVVYKDPYSGGLMQVLTRPGQPASVLGLEVPENFRNQGIAGRLQGQALKDFPNMQGQVSSKAAAKSAYKLGRRPVGRPDASLDDVLQAIDEDSSVNLVSPARQKEISGAYSR